ncbi:PP2C family protein-serine/threonine phosphatase [Luteolibacter sp. AS25]|uniref:PP2C family protein-serine/threonine phosphatase n=1 Tax=Luteolibacter sp. AS25 TaxID=3135776 RepID=UPI00398AE204
MDKKISIRWAALSQSGTKNPENEDSWIAFSSDAKASTRLAESGEMLLELSDLVFAVSDGMGGGNAGEIASSLILEQLAERIPETFRAAAAGFFPDSISHLADVIRRVNEEINRIGEESENNKGMSATLALSWFSPENMYLANIGDSRVYRCRAEKIEQVSKDHTAAWASWKRGDIREVEYRSHPRRSALYEVMGGGHENVFPFFAAIPFMEGDRFLLCSDGLIDGVWERHIGESLMDSATPEECCSALLKRAVANSGIDDTTLIVIHIGAI